MFTFLWSLLASWCFGAEVARLGNDDYETREEAHDTLHAAGWIAYPAIAAGTANPNPEISARAERLIRPFLRQLADAEAAAILLGLIEPDYSVLWLDYPMRRRLNRIAERMGCSWYQCSGFKPENDPDPVTCFFCEIDFWSGIQNAVRQCRIDLKSRI